MATGIIEIKSMSDFAFNRALKGEIDKDYLAQAWVYYKATDFDPVIFICYRKETSAMVEIIFSRACTQKIITQRLTGDSIQLAKVDPILLTEIKSPFDTSVEEYVRERIRWLKQTRDFPAEHDVREFVKIVPGADAVEDEIERVQGLQNAEKRLDEIGSREMTKSGSWYSFKTGRKVLGFPCSYCGHIERCYPQVKMELKGDKPIWVVDV